MADRDDNNLRPPRARRPDSIWTDTQRATVGRAGLSSEIRRRARDGSAGDGIPLPPPVRSLDEVTQPIDILERDLSQSQIEIIRNSKRNGKDPVVYEDLIKFLDAFTKEKSENREREAAYDAVIQSPHKVAKELHERVAATEATLRTARRLAIAAVVSLAGGVGTFASGVLNRTEAAGGDKVRLEQFRRDVDRIDGELRDIRITLGRRSALDRAAPAASLNVSTKGTSQ